MAPPSPPISPASSFLPSLASSLPVLSSSLLLAPQSLISVPTSLEKGRGTRGDAAKAFGIGDVAFGARRRR